MAHPRLSIDSLPPPPPPSLENYQDKKTSDYTCDIFQK